MNAYRSQLQTFLNEARKWEDRLRRTTYSNSVAFQVDSANGEFSITAYWVTRGGERGQHTKRFSIDYLFGTTVGTAQPRIQKRVCNCMREFMQEVLHARGV
jgi:hypothetical protein